MGLFTRNSLSGIVNRRKTTIKKFGSPTYVWETGIIVAAATEYCGVSNMFPAAAKYQPLDCVEIINNSAQNVRVWLNGVALNYLVPAGTIREITEQAFWDITVENIGAGNTVAGEVALSLKRGAYTVDKAAQGFSF